jgi:guanylate kinase
VSSSGGPDVEHGARLEPAGEGRVVVLSGPSAVGKSTVVRCLRKRIPNLHFSVSATTRAPRPGEVDGVDYHFVSSSRFQQLIDEGALLEWAEIHGGLQRSGTLAEPVRAATASGLPVLIEVDLAGARAVKKAMPEAITVFLAPPSWADLEARLVGRGTETPEVMSRRLDTARIELAAQDDFDEVVVNRQLESACAELVSLLVGNAPGSA